MLHAERNDSASRMFRWIQEVMSAGSRETAKADLRKFKRMETSGHLPIPSLCHNNLITFRERAAIKQKRHPEERTRDYTPHRLASPWEA